MGSPPLATDVEVWVRAGIYHPNEAATPPAAGFDSRAATFLQQKNVAILGGFITGLETAKNQRNPAANVTILSGDLGTDGHSHHVVTAQAVAGGSGMVDSTAVLDGFTITGGDADQSEIDEGLRIGGGVVLFGPTGSSLNEVCAPTIMRCRIHANQALCGGGIGMKISQASEPVFGSCSITSNTASNDGGGAYVRGNASTMGGKPKFVNCLFTANVAEGSAGTGPVGSGGAVYSDTHARPSLINCTISKNQSATTGLSTGVGGVHQESICIPGPSRSDGVIMLNTIVWDNTGYSIAGEVHADYCTVQDDSGDDLCSATQLNSTSPAFISAGSGNFHLASNSPAIDAGLIDTFYLVSDAKDINQNGDITEYLPDLDLRKRIAGAYSSIQECRIIDQGAFEFSAPICQADFVPAGGDGTVGVAELLAVISAWGACPGAPAACLPDIAPQPCGNRTVGVSDLLAVISNWGPCAGPTAPGDEGGSAGAPQTVEDCMNMCAPLGAGSQAYINCMTKCTSAIE